MGIEEIRKYFSGNGSVINRRAFEKKNGLYHRCISNIMNKSTTPDKETISLIIKGIENISKIN